MKKRLLTLAWLLCPLLFMAQAMADFTVYVKVNTTKTVNLYFWGVDGATSLGWPGNEMTETTKHNYTTGADDELYTYTISGTSAASINGIFNLGGSPQTDDLTLVNGGIYEWNGENKAGATDITGNYTNTASTYKVYFEDPGWDEVYAYPFSNDAAVDEAWPGKKINKNGAGKYEYSYTATSAPNYIIFNNGSNRQTPDLTFADGKTYTHVYTVVGSSTALFGGTNVWTADLPVNDMTANSDGTYTWTKEGVELSEDVVFKVTYGHDGWNLNYGAGCTVNGDNVTIEIPETATYDVTITLDLANNSLTGVATKQGGTEQNATITSVQYAGDDNSWTGADFTADATAANKYTYELDLSSNTENIGFKFLPNGNWLGYGNVTLDAPTGWITDSGEPNHNFVLNNASTGYQKYLITATWEENPSATEGWTLKVEGTEERPATSTYNATFVNTPGWENVYAYVFANDAPIDNVEWPGVKLTAGDADTYSYSAELTTSPQYIIFHNGVTGEGADQTDDLTWKNGKQYTVAVEYINLLGDMNNWDTSAEALFTKSPDAENTWIIEDIDLSSTTEDQEFKLFVNDNWLGFNDITINAPEGWLVDDGTDDHDIKFMNSITGFKTYSLTATWTPNGKINKGWTLTMTGKEQREAEINAPTSVQIPGGWNGWNAEDLTATINEESGNYVYTTEVDLTTFAEDPSFKLKINNGGDETDNWGGWLGWAAMESGALVVDRPDGWVYEKEGDGDRNLMLANSISGYQKYQFTATWVPSNNPYTGWTLKIEGTEERQPVADTYTYYVVGNETLTGVNWDKDDANKFIENEGAYTLTKEGVEINKGEYSYKVIAVNDNTGAWTWMPEGMDNDDIVNIPSNGKYNITWTLNIDEIGTTDYPYSYELEKVDMVYSVVGASPGVWYQEEDPIFGHAWMSNETSNDMTLDDTATVPTYTWKKENVELNAGNIEMKVIKNHLYGDQGGAEWPSQNKVLAVEAGTYNIAISFVPSTGEVTITAEPVSQEVKDKYVYYVDMQNWTPSAHIWNNDGDLTPDWTQGVADHTLNAFGNEYSVSKYEFAGEPTNIMFMGADDSQKTSDMPFVNGATYGNDGDAANGVFIFSDDENQFKPEQNVNVNGNAKYVRQFTVGEPCTVVLPFALGADKVGDNAEAGQVGVFYRITAIAEGQINGNTEVPGAYTPYVFIPAVEYPFTYVGFGQLPAVPETKNYALNGGDVVFEWVTTATTVTSDNEWTYYGWDKSTHKFVKAAVGQANPFRSYIKIKTDKLGSMGLSAKESIDLSFINGGEATAISALRAAIADGEATVFDLQGRKVDNPTMRGVYIVNGKKYVVK